MRSPEPEKRRPLRNALRRLIKAPAVLAILWPAILIVGGYLAWHRWGSVHVAENFYGVELAQINVTEPPPHVRSNVVQAVYRDTAMDGLSLLDRQATANIAAAFSMHPWVQSVSSVRKLPGGMVEVRLEYRQPVAMVTVFRSKAGKPAKYYFPIDGKGVLLPTSEFTRGETQNFIHIDVPGVDSSNAEGMPFGDKRVEAAASLAALLHPIRSKISVKSISVAGDPRQVQVPQLELTTDSEARLFWGSPPGLEAPGEPTAMMKLQTLLSLDAATNADLRMAAPGKRPIH